MYLKNISNAAIALNTVVGKIGIKPGEYVDIKYKILPPMSASLIEITEEEFNSFRNPAEEIQVISQPEENGNTSQVPELVQPEEQTIIEETVVDSSIDTDQIEIKDPGVMGFVNALLNPGQDNKDVAQTEALKVTEAGPDTQINQLEQQIQDLKGVWSTATSPRKKEKIGKEIKELQKQLKKLKK